MMIKKTMTVIITIIIITNNNDSSNNNNNNTNNNNNNQKEKPVTIRDWSLPWVSTVPMGYIFNLFNLYLHQHTQHIFING